MTQGIQSVFDRLWLDFTRFNPPARKIHQLLTDRGDRVVHDHIALRTFRHDKLGIDATATLFERHGYRACGEYDFPERRIHARHYASNDPDLPSVFISELDLAECSRGLRDIVGSLLRQVDCEALADDALVCGGCPWHPILYDSYERLRVESEYAAWVATFGYRANNFTLLVNELDSFASLAQLNEFLKQNGFELNDRQGEVKGSPAELLEQSATVAPLCDVQFADAKHEIPGCYYEFAWRHPLPDGTRFPGFVVGNADLIFESTDHPLPP